MSERIFEFVFIKYLNNPPKSKISTLKIDFGGSKIKFGQRLNGSYVHTDFFTVQLLVLCNRAHLNILETVGKDRFTNIVYNFNQNW